ncbi:hypothetical protein DL96DRAFT_798463 [Flagelloscypha sp. PMI_526]|nr:hypothetical protein DL96DRAFT_798463 [Flagelloscypha sp. PMI_526]
MLTQAAMVATILSNQTPTALSNPDVFDPAPPMTFSLVLSFPTEVSLTDSPSTSESPTSFISSQFPEATHFNSPTDPSPTTQNEHNSFKDSSGLFDSPNSRHSSYTFSSFRSSSSKQKSYISGSPASTTTLENHTQSQHLTSVAVSPSVPQSTLSSLQTTQTAPSASTTQQGETTSLAPSNGSRPRREVLGAVLGAFFGILLLSTVID